VVLNDWAAIGGLKDQTYYEGLFEFDEGECLLLETDVPETVRYWQVLLADQLFNTIEWEKCQSSLNGHQAKLDSDGRFRAVICNLDPGVPNWLDTGGYQRGAIQVRWNNCSAAPNPVATKVKLADLRRHIPADTPVVSPAERETVLRERRWAAQMRRRW